MQQIRLLHKEFEKELSFIHKTRLNCLINTCTTAANNNKLYLTGLGRKDSSKTKTSSNIEKVNRLLGNKHIHQERKSFYQMMTSRLISRFTSPWIHVDWSCINATTKLYVLRASLSLTGRSIVVYEKCYPKKKENNHGAHKEFLAELKGILPSDIAPVIVTDAGFRAPWFNAVRQLGWHFVGRLRNKNLVRKDGIESWELSSHLFAKATGKPTYSGHFFLTEKGQVPTYVVLYKGKSKERHQYNLIKKLVHLV